VAEVMTLPKKKRKKGLVMRKLFLMLAVLLVASTAYAADVTVSCAQVADTNEVIVSYVASAEANIPRAFALDIQLDNDETILSVTPLDPNYWVYPGTYPGGEPIGDPCDSSDTLPGIDTNGVTIEMASLHSPPEVSSPNAPEQLNDLLSITVSGTCNMSIAGNAARGKVVLYDATNEDDGRDIVYTGCTINIVTDCLIGGNAGSAEFSDWETWGKPDCWCYQRQCRGDINGSKLGPYWVQAADLATFKAAYFKTNAVLATVPNGICADLNHKPLGPYRVQAADLTIFKTYYFKAEALVPPCDAAPVITGPYNFWTTP
jgi:hypothetical protein